MANLTEDQKTLIRNTWSIVGKNKELVGKAFFREMFNTFPEYVAYFNKNFNLPLDSEAILADAKFAEEHIIGNVMNAIGKLVNNIDNPNALETVLVQLGKNHKKRNLNQQHFENAKKLLVNAVKTHLANNNSWTPQIEQAWGIFIEYVFGLIYKGL